MKFVTMMFLATTAAMAQQPKPAIDKPAPPAAKAPAPADPTAGDAALQASTEDQDKIDLAWKDMRIAELEVQTAVQQALADLGPGAYYDVGKHAFYRHAVVPPAKPDAPASKQPGAKTK